MTDQETAVTTVQPVDVIAHAQLPVAGLMQLIVGHYSTQVLSVLARLGVPDQLAEGGAEVGALAAGLGVRPDALLRLLRAAASLGVLEHTQDGNNHTFSLTEAGHFLRSDYPFSMRDLAVLEGTGWHWDAWSGAADSLVDGRTTFERNLGTTFYEHVDATPGGPELYARAMANLASQGSYLALFLYDFTGFDTIVDVAGGEGGLLATLLGLAPNASGVLFDLPSVAGPATEALAKAGVGDRVEVVSGDMFASVPEGGDAYLLSMVVNDYDDDRAALLLRNVAAAMPADGRLIILDMTVPEAGTPSFASLIDFECLAVSGGRARTRPELEALLAGAGFRLQRFERGISPVALLEAVRA